MNKSQIMMTVRQLLFILLPLCTAFSYGQMTPTFDDVQIPMRDGQNLEADVYIPVGVDSAEVILIQTPYNKNLFSWSLPLGVGQNLNAQPYIWVIVDWRGFYGSAPAFVAQPNRGEDGYDVCEWIVDQTWHKERIGTWGPSALGGVQYNLAREQHPNHTCAVPLVATGIQSFSTYFTGGVLERARLDQLDALGYGVSTVVLANPYDSPLWQFSANSTEFAPDIHIPTLQIGGWYDHNIDAMIDFYEKSRTLSDASVQDEQWLLVGPWVHGGSGAAYVGSSIQGELSYPMAEFKSDSMAWDFLNYYLLDSNNNWENTDLITYFELGQDQWAVSNLTSIENTNSNTLFFDNGEALVSGFGAGSSTFISDPKNPSPTIGGATLHSTLEQGPFDQISLESRNDIKTFQTDPLSQDVQISGRVIVNSIISTDQEDCDISVRLVDVYPDGRNMLITDGIKRARFINGYEQVDEAFLVPGTVYDVEVVLPFTNYTWLAGHRIKVFIGGNNAYRYDVNLQNGDAMYVAGDTNVANITIHHDAVYPSKITLPGSNGFLTVSEFETPTFSIYPNPSSESIYVTFPIAEQVEISIFDFAGRQVSASQKVDGNSHTLNLSNLPNGSYLIQASFSDGHSEHRKFIKR